MLVTGPAAVPPPRPSLLRRVEQFLSRPLWAGLLTVITLAGLAAGALGLRGGEDPPAAAPSPSAAVTTAATTPGSPPGTPGSPSPTAAPGSGPAGSASAPAGSAYRREFSGREFRIPWPRCLSWADLDRRRLFPSGNGSGEDLTYGMCSPTGLGNYGSSQLGEGPLTEPATGEECADAAGSRGLELVPPADLLAGRIAFCVVTDEGNVSWLRLVRTTQASPCPMDTCPNLVFRQTLWRPAG